MTATGQTGEHSGEHLEGGTYRIGPVPSGDEYSLRVRAPGYLDHEEVRAVADAGETDTAIELSGDSALEIGAETDEGAPVVNASVSVTGASGTTIEPRERTGDDGTLELEVPGTNEGYAIDGSSPAHESVTVESGAVEAGSSTAVSVVFSTESAPARLPYVGALAAAFAALTVGLARLVRD